MHTNKVPFRGFTGKLEACNLPALSIFILNTNSTNYKIGTLESKKACKYLLFEYF